MNANPMAMVAAVKKKNLYLYLYEREEREEREERREKRERRERRERRDRNEQQQKLRNEVRSNQGEKL